MLEKWLNERVRKWEIIFANELVEAAIDLFKGLSRDICLEDLGERYWGICTDFIVPKH